MKKLILSSLLFLIPLLVQAQSFQVIVNEANPVSEISTSDISKIFLKTKSSWEDGSKVIPIDLNARSATRGAFSQEIHGRSVGAIRSHWQQAAFSGAGTAPVERSGDSDVITFVRNNPGAIGYVSVDADVTGVKVITIN